MRHVPGPASLASFAPLAHRLCPVLFAAMLFGTSSGAPPTPAETSTTPAPTAPTPATPPPAGCTAAEHRQFDFWAGEWSVKDAGDGSDAGTNSITRILGGCVLLESWRGADGMEGTSFNIYDRADGSWHQTWVDSRGTRLEIAGGWRDGRMILEGKDRKGPRGGFLRDRITWTPLPGGTVRQHWEQSRDGGATWSTAFDGIYARK